MTKKFTVSKQAKKEIQEIAAYTLRKWGRSQRNSYLKELEDCFERLADNPGLGRARPELKEGYHSFPTGRHVVYYRIFNHRLSIISVLHQSRDVAKFFDA